MKWKTVYLEDLVVFQRGFDITKAEQQTGTIPVVSSSGIGSYHNVAKNTAPGIVIGRKGTLGSVFYLQTPFWAHDTTLWAKEIKGDARFIYYLLRVLKLEQFDVGGANPTLNRNHIHKIKILIPPIDVQKKISKILSNYDDYITNNDKRIKLLEESGRLIYEEWFLRFKIDDVKLNINQETGLPSGWIKKSITKFSSFKQDKSKVKKFIGNKTYLATADISGSQIASKGETITWESKPSRAQIKPNKNTVWFARMSNTYKVLCFHNKNIKLQDELVLSSGFAGFKAKNDLCLPFLFFTINSNFFHELKNLYATGATQVSLNNDSMNFMKLVEPELSVIEKYGEKVLPLIEEISILVEQNQLLKEARDILLPRLMTGMIDVDNMEVAV